MEKQRLEELASIYSETYTQLYESDTELSQIIESTFCKAHDKDIKSDPDYREAVKALANYREDIFTSDRECAAVYLATMILQRRDYMKHLAEKMRTA